MRGAPLLALLLLLPLLPAARADAPPATLELVATEVDGKPVFLDAAGQQAPLLHAFPGATITIHLVNHGALRHGVQLETPVSEAAPCCIAPGGETNLTVTLPAGFVGDITYSCPLHGAQGMRGALRVQAPAPTVRLAAPANGTTIHGAAEARAVVENGTLGPGLALRWTLDGAVVPNATGATLPLVGLAQRDHLVQVALVNASGAVLSTEESFFFADAALPPTATSTPEPTATPAASTPARTPGPELALAFAVLALSAFTRSRAR
ncbi:MAG: hypothetical protein QOE90_445 [Thermoplasmata archaeon]|jgi:hypothetical protein|nr:hypothetical protein [Thermoplasmata archaeon]